MIKIYVEHILTMCLSHNSSSHSVKLVYITLLDEHMETLDTALSPTLYLDITTMCPVGQVRVRYIDCASHVCKWATNSRPVSEMRQIFITMAHHFEIDNFVIKFKNLWSAGLDATLNIESNAGQAFVILKLGLERPSQIPPQNQFYPRHFPRNPRYVRPARHRRRERREAARRHQQEVAVSDEKADASSVAATGDGPNADNEPVAEEVVGDTIAEESIDTEKYVTEAVIDVAFAEEANDEDSTTVNKVQLLLKKVKQKTIMNRQQKLKVKKVRQKMLVITVTLQENASRRFEHSCIKEAQKSVQTVFKIKTSNKKIYIRKSIKKE